ncbi:MAG: alanine dehydrogenase, partial [Flavobacteriales bacterium]
VSPEEFLQNPNENGVYTHLDTPEMYARIDGTPFNKSDFYANPNLYTSALGEYVKHGDIYFACHLWNAKNPILLDQSFFQLNTRCKVVAVVSCDLKGPWACTIRPSNLSDSVFGYDPTTGTEVDFRNENAVAVMSIDNLPCELPKDASEDFGNEIVKSILPALLNNDADGILWKGTETTLEGTLTPHFEYLKDYVATAR